MSEIKSNSSYAISAIEFNSKSLNPLDSINPAVLNKIKRQADNYVGCANKCTLIWNALAKNDIAGEHLSQKVLQTIFKQYQSDLYNFTKIASLRDFMRIFDQDKDGCLNSDQQIGIFSFIKQKIQIVANNCLQIQIYIKYEALMRQVRLLQENISKWQGILRTKIHSNQLKQYKKQGVSRVDQFCEKFDKQFQNLQNKMIQRRQNFQKQAYYESQELEQRLSHPREYFKIKPTNRLKQLQVQQKLVSLQQRVYEALDFRRQLSQLQITQRDRVDRLMLEHANQERQVLRSKHTRQRGQLQTKLQQLQSKQTTKMKCQFSILVKKNNLHQNQIKRLQGIQRQWAHKKALFEPQLKRTKKLQKQRDQVLQQYKKRMFSDNKLTDDVQGMSKINARSLLEATLKFKLTDSSTSDVPVNSKKVERGGNMGHRIHKYIRPKMGQTAFSLSKMYDGNMDRLEVQAGTSQNLRSNQNARKYNFVMERLNR